MAITQSLGLRPSLAMTARMQASLRILGMSAPALAAYLEEAERKNPFLTVRLPPSYPAKGSDFDAVAALADTDNSLFAHVSQQIELSFRDDADKAIAYAFVESLEPTGWLSASAQQVARTCGCAHERAEAVLTACQNFEPAGLFARSLAECLRLQAREAGHLDRAMAATLDNLDAVAEGGQDQVAQDAGVTPAEIAAALGRLRSFDPKPGLVYTDRQAQIAPPDLSITRTAADWQVDLNWSTLPTVEVAAAPDMVTLAGDPRRIARSALAEAHWLSRTFDRRNSTLLAAASAIVARQVMFLEHGPGHLRPLALSDIAEDLKLHVSTISRATGGRRMETPHGVLPLRAFFTRAVGDRDDGQTRDGAMAVIRRIVEAEDPARPLSDAVIATRAKAEGADISRRAVAKYRDLLGIPNSYQRKRIAAR